MMEDYKRIAAENQKKFDELQQMMRDYENQKCKDKEQKEKRCKNENIDNYDNTFSCYWCHDIGHLKRHCKIYHEWKNTRTQKEASHVKSDNPVLSVSDVRIKIDFQCGKTRKKFWIRVSNDQTMLEFRRTICKSVNCEFNNDLALSIDGYEFLSTETVTILRDNDILKCVVPCTKGKKTNSIGTQCKSMVKFSNRGIQCDSSSEMSKPSTERCHPETESNKLEKSTVTGNETTVDNKLISQSSSGYRTTGKTGQSKVKRKSNLNEKSAFVKRSHRHRHNSSSVMDTPSSSDTEYNEKKPVSVGTVNLRGNSQNCVCNASSSAVTKDKCANKTVKCDDVHVPPHLWHYYDKLGWSIYYV